MNRRSKLLLVFFILFFPSLFYIFLSTGKHKFIHLPYYGEKVFVNGDSAFRPIHFPELTNHKNIKLDSTYLALYVKVVNIFNTQCTDDCDPTTAQFVQLQEKLKDYSKVKLFSISNNSHDSIPGLNTYAEKVHVNYANVKWHLVKALDSASTVKLVASLTLKEEQEKLKTTTFNSVYLIDKESHIRGYYNGSSLKEINRLVDDIKVLLAEYSIEDKKKKK